MNEDEYTDEQIRDWYAGEALAGICFGFQGIPHEHEGAVAKACFDIADSMMSERKKRQTWQKVSLKTESQTDQPISPS